jgi:Ca-activated chloride channel family protein
MTLLNAFRFNAMMNPELLVLLAGVLALFVVECFARPTGAMRVSTGETLAQIKGHRHSVLRRVPPALRALGLALLVVALARPLHGLSPQKDKADIIDIMLCVDVSRSMGVMDFLKRGERKTRLDVSKDAVLDFIASRKSQKEDRYGLDRLGLILYAKYAWTQTPLTLDYDVLVRDLMNTKIEDGDRSRSGTAIGSAIGLAVSRLRKSEAKTKIAILLTDGRNNEGELDPLTAAQLAKEYGIKVYTVGAATGENVIIERSDPFGTRFQEQVHFPIDEDTLRRIAEITSAQYFRATDVESLQNAYLEISKLETTEIELGDYYDYTEGFMPWAASGLVCVLAAILGRRLWFEAIP